MTTANVGAVRPLGIFGVVCANREFARFREQIVAATNELPLPKRAAIANYLRSGGITFAIMEHTYDVVAKAFGVPGGGAMQTDGTYYWRRDTADYVERYGVGLPVDFMEHGRRLGWSPPSLTRQALLEIDAWMMLHAVRVDSFVPPTPGAPSRHRRGGV